MITMLILKQDKIVCHLTDSRLVDGISTNNDKQYRNYAIHFTLQVNGTLKDIRTTLGITEDGFYVQENFVAVENVLRDLGYPLSGKEVSSIYSHIKYNIDHGTSQSLEK